jgi:Ran GTPase-activating protein (RanGAP) involved in mRNA processing and transport
LNTLVISGNALGVDGTAALANLIEKNATLTELDASQCSLLAEGAQLLATALQANASLRSLSLSGNVQLQQKYCALILQALESEDSAVSSLDLRNCGIGFQHSPCTLLTADDGKRLTVATCDGPCGKTILSGCVCHGCSSCG